MIETIRLILEQAGFLEIGFCSTDGLLVRQTAKSRALGFSPRSAAVVAVGYAAQELPGNLSRYARGADYHKVLGAMLEQSCRDIRSGLQLPCAWFCDSSPCDEVSLAVRAGLGQKGRNQLLLNSRYGSWCFLGEILFDRLFSNSQDCPPSECEACGACALACPGGALGQAGFGADRCLSALTQKKGILSESEQALLKKGGMVWGCDACQRCCPHNRNAARSNQPGFLVDLISNLTAEQVSAPDFVEQYGDRAFLWRGSEVLLRNLKLLGE